MDIYFTLIYAPQIHFLTHLEGEIYARLGPWKADKTSQSETL